MKLTPKELLYILIEGKKIFIDIISARIHEESDLIDKIINDTKLEQAKHDLEFYDKLLTECED